MINGWMRGSDPSWPGVARDRHARRHVARAPGGGGRARARRRARAARDAARLPHRGGRRRRVLLQALDGDAEPFGGPRAGMRIPRVDTLCDRMLSGRIANVVPDVAQTPGRARTRRLPGVGAYVGVPVRLADGTVYGSLCCVSAEADAGAARARRAHARGARADHRRPDRARTPASAACIRLEGEASAGQALLAALKARERYTAEHSEAVVELATAVARDARPVRASRCSRSPRWRCCTTSASSACRSRSCRSRASSTTRSGGSCARIRRSASGSSARSRRSRISRPRVRAEHERWDGTGYPDGLAGSAIPLASRICLACDAWHAMTSDRPYRAALSPASARAELERNAGTQFCPRTVDALLAVLGRRTAAAVPSARRSCRRAGAAGVRAARADRRRRCGRSRPPARGRARGRRRGDPPRGRRVVGLDQPLGARAPPRPDADQRRRARPGRGALPDAREL